MPDLDATCSLDLGCPVDEFLGVLRCASRPYRRRSREYQRRREGARGLDGHVVDRPRDRGRPARARREDHLGAGSPSRQLHPEENRRGHAARLVPRSRRIQGYRADLLRAEYPDAKVLVHPESPENVVAQADVVGSTTQLIDAAVKLDATHFIVATDLGILHKMQLAAPGKTFIAAPTAGNSRHCKRALPVDGDERPRELVATCSNAVTTRSSSIPRSASAHACQSTGCSISRPRTEARAGERRSAA